MARPADHRAKIELLRAAEAEFAEHGLAAAKVEDITSRAGVSKGAFYLHWDSKEECWRQIIEGFVARLADSIEPKASLRDDPPKSIEDALTRWREHDCEILEFCWQNKSLLKMILGGGGGAPYGYLVDELAERAAKQAEDWVRQAKEAGFYREDVDPVIAAALISGAYDRLARELIRQPKRPDIDAWCRQVQDLFTRGLLRRPARDGRADEDDPKVRNRERASAGASAGSPTRVRGRRARAV